MEGAAHRALREQYRTLPRVTGLGDQLDGEDIEGPRGFNKQRKEGVVSSLTTYPHPTIRRIMEHDVIVAMHHRLMNLHHGYQQGVGNEPGHYSFLLDNELSGMSRYSGSPRLQARFPWSGNDAGFRATFPPEDEGVMYHATPKPWSGPIDPQKTRIGPSYEGGAGFYGTDQPSVAAAYRGPNGSQEGPTYRYSVPIRGMSMFLLDTPNSDVEDVEIEPYRRKRMFHWMRDMASRYLGPKQVSSMHLAISRGDKEYTSGDLHRDIAALTCHIYPTVAEKSQLGNNNAYLLRDLGTHLMTMVLTAAGYHGTTRERSYDEGAGRFPSHEVYSFFPVSWALLRRTAEIPGQLPDASRAYDDLASLDPLLRRVRTIRARQPRAKGATERISRTNPWKSA